MLPSLTASPPPACHLKSKILATRATATQMLQRLQDDPPAPLVALQTRLAALYPEYQLCHMPEDAMQARLGTNVQRVFSLLRRSRFIDFWPYFIELVAFTRANRRLLCL